MLVNKFIFFISSIIYKGLTIFKVRANRVIMECDYGKGFYGNLQYIYEEIEREKLPLEIIIPINKGVEIKIKEDDKVKIVRTRTPKHLYYLATSKLWITNNHYYHFLEKRKETTMINTWHALGAFKKFGLDSAKTHEEIERFKADSKNIDYLLVSSEELKPIYSKALGVNENKILSMGIPRTDILFNEVSKESIRGAFLSKYPELKNKKVILYAPTFRDDEKMNFNMKLNLHELQNKLGEDYKFLYKLHPIIRNPYVVQEELKDFAIDMGKENINDLMIIADLLITDYSSVIFEYSLLNKPMIFFAYDYDKYKNQLRNFYFDFEEFIPGNMVTTTEEIIDFVGKVDRNDFDKKKILEFSKRFCEYTDGEASKRFVKKFI